MNRVELPPGFKPKPSGPEWWMLSNLPAGVREGVAKVLADYADDPPLYRVVTAFVHAARAGAIPDFARVGERVSIPDVVPALRYGRDAVLKALPADLRGASEPRLQRLIEATRSVRVAFLSVPFDEVWCRKPKCAEPHMLPGPWMEAIKNHDDALADVLTLFPFADTGTDAGGGGGSAAPDIHRVKLSPSVDAGDASRAFGAALARFGSGLRDLIAENPPDLEARLAADAEGLPNEVAVGYWQVVRNMQGEAAGVHNRTPTPTGGSTGEGPMPGAVAGAKGAGKANARETVVVLWEGAEHSDRNIRLARTRTAYLEASGNVVATMRALAEAGYRVRSKQTIYNHLDALDKACPRWRERIMRPTTLDKSDALDSTRIVRTRRKSRGATG